MMLGAIQSQMLIGKRIKHWSPADLFANGEQGSLWGPLPYYSDAAGTVEADWGDPVGFIPDASGNGNDWAQVTSTARPILGRVPVGGRRNLLTWTEDLSNPVWIKASGLTVDYAGDGWWLVDKQEGDFPHLRHNYGTVLYAGEVHSIEIELMAGSTSSLQIGLYRGGWPSSVNLSARILSGPGSLSGSQVPKVSGLSATEKTVLQLSRKFTLDEVGGNAGLYIYPNELAGSSLGSVRVRFPSVSRLEDLAEYPPPYQRVGNEYDITEAGVPSVYYLRFDGTDDDLPNTLPAIQGTIVLAGVNGIWIDSLDFAGGAFSVGPDTYTGGPTGLMSILGDILERGCFVIDRALTPKEIAQVKGYYKARGSAGLFQLGSETLVNGTFDTDTGWTKFGGWSIGSGVASHPEGSSGEIYQAVSGGLSDGQAYIAGFAVVSSGGAGTDFRLRLGDSAGWVSGLSKSPGIRRVAISRAAYGGSLFSVFAAPTVQVDIDNASVRKLELIP